MLPKELKSDIQKVTDPRRAQVLQRFFKTGKGQYGEGDIFIGITLPNLRNLAKKYKDLPLNLVKDLLSSKVHEERVLALSLLVNKFTKGDHSTQKQIYKVYLGSVRHINNWDLVDISAPKIVGEYLKNHPDLSGILNKLAKSNNLWKKRIAIISTFSFIREGDFTKTLEIAETLLHDTHDLIHKAVGWMLREVGKKSLKAEQDFLKEHYQTMPRTMLRYAIEKFPERLRQKYLHGHI